MGKRTKFYLGYELNGQYTPLTFLDNKLELIDDKLTAVIDYTTSFDNEAQLRESITKGAMNVDIPANAKFVYLQATNNPHFPYRKVLGTDHICYSISKSLQSPQVQRDYFTSNKYDEELFEKLYKTILLSKISMSDLRKFYTKEDLQNDTPSRMINIFNKHKNEIGNGNNYIISFVDGVYNEVRHANNVGINNYEYDHDTYNLDYLIERLYDNLTILKDKDKNSRHDPNTGQFLRDDLIMGYLTILISEDMEEKFLKYRDYIEAQTLEYEEKEQHTLDDVVYTEAEGHDEEFLTTEDFAKYDEDPESVGYKTRKSGI